MKRGVQSDVPEEHIPRKRTSTHFDTHHFHCFKRQTGDCFGMRIISKIDPPSYQTLVRLLSLVFEWHLATFDHHSIEYPISRGALNVRNNLFVFGVDEVLVLLEKFLGIVLHEDPKMSDRPALTD